MGSEMCIRDRLIASFVYLIERYKNSKKKELSDINWKKEIQKLARVARKTFGPSLVAEEDEFHKVILEEVVKIIG